jgi:cell wall-associated NlpC family hydrolase
MLKQLGQPTQLDSHASEAGDVLYGVGGFNPGRTFSQEGAAFGSAAELQAGDAILRGGENVKSIEAQRIVADKGFQDKIAEMAGQLPGDIQANYGALRKLALDDAKFRETVRKDNIDLAMKQADQKLAYAKYTTGISEFNSKQQLNYAKLANEQFNQNRDYQVKLANLGIAQTKLQQTILKNSFAAANGGLSKQQVAKYTSVAQSIAMQGFNGITAYTTKGGVKQPGQNTGKVSYFEALGQALKKGIPVQIALDALDRVYPPQYRPSPEALAQQLGALDPKALQQVAYNQVTQARAGLAMTNPTALLTHGASAVTQIAKGMLGTPYVWGGNQPGKALDCSGFVCQVFKQVGVSLPRTTQQMVKAGKGVSLQQLQPGDLVFTEPGKNGLPGHVGIYVGNGQIQESPHSGDVNKYIPLQSFLSGGFVAARRVLP